MLILKQATATQNVLIGPFVDKTNGADAETSLSIANTDIRISKAGADTVAKNSGGATHDEIGYYQITLDATDTSATGTLQVMVHMTADALPVYNEFQVVEENVYVAMFAASAALGTDVASILTDTGTTIPGTITTIDNEIAVIDTNVDQIETAVITNAAGVDVAADIIALKAETVLIVADTGELQADDVPGLIASLDTVVDRVETDTQDIQSRLPAALVNSRMDSSIDATGMESGAVATILTTQMTEAYATDGAAPTIAQALMMIQQLLGEFAISGTTLTMKKVDGSTSAATFTLDDGTNPTSLTRAT
jgi:hypothetical protein